MNMREHFHLWKLVDRLISQLYRDHLTECDCLVYSKNHKLTQSILQLKTVKAISNRVAKRAIIKGNTAILLHYHYRHYTTSHIAIPYAGIPWLMVSHKSVHYGCKTGHLYMTSPILCFLLQLLSIPIVHYTLVLPKKKRYARFLQKFCKKQWDAVNVYRCGPTAQSEM